MEAIAGIGWCRPASDRKISARCRDVFCPNPSDFRASDLWARRSSEPSIGYNAPPHLIDALLSSDMKADGQSGFRTRCRRLARGPNRAHAANREKQPQRVNEGPRIALYLRFSLQCPVPGTSTSYERPARSRFRPCTDTCQWRRRNRAERTADRLFHGD